jgi:hypothetical protein
VKLLVDMNLLPSWVDRLAHYGFEAVHWFTIGVATAPDVEILTWANEHHIVVITNDLLGDPRYRRWAERRPTSHSGPALRGRRAHSRQGTRSAP